jgi:integrase
VQLLKTIATQRKTMPSKKVNFSQDEHAIYDDAVIYKRGDYWQMRMWLKTEHKYARFSLKTRNQSTAVDKAKLHYHELMSLQLAGKTYFSYTTKQGVQAYLEQRYKDYEAGLIVIGRYRTIATHLAHWLAFIGKDTKVKELERTDCENYFHSRSKAKGTETLKVSQTTVENEQSTINAMMAWLYKRKESYIDGFDFKKLKAIDRGAEENRRQAFTDIEVVAIDVALKHYISDALTGLTIEANLVKAVCGYYLGISMITGMRRGELLQLKWGDIEEMEGNHTQRINKLIKITVRGVTSKVRKTRKFVIRDSGYFNGLFTLKRKLDGTAIRERELLVKLSNELMFTANTGNAITARAIGIHFEKLLEKASVRDANRRGLVPYSFRHTFITKRVNSNLPPAAVAEMCGTSITQIEKTYYHTTEAKMVSNALADYTYKDGLLIPK